MHMCAGMLDHLCGRIHICISIQCCLISVYRCFYNCLFCNYTVCILCLITFGLSIEEQTFPSGGGDMTSWLPNKRPLLRPPQQIWPFYWPSGHSDWESPAIVVDILNRKIWVFASTIKWLCDSKIWDFNKILTMETNPQVPSRVFITSVYDDFHLKSSWYFSPYRAPPGQQPELQS